MDQDHLRLPFTPDEAADISVRDSAHRWQRRRVEAGFGGVLPEQRELAYIEHATTVAAG
jgi:hypothetical protein